MIEIILAKDVFEVQSIANQLLPKTYNDIMSTEEIDYLVDVIYSKENINITDKEDDVLYFVALDNNKLVGFVALYRVGPNLYRLSKIFVQSLKQNQGIGTMLFKSILDYFNNKYVKNTNIIMELSLNCNNKTKNFYESLGMVKVRDDNLDIGNGFILQQDVMSYSYNCI